VKNIFNNKNFLLPYKFKLAGIALLVPAITLIIIRFYFGVKLDLFTFKVFALHSSYLNLKSFQLIDNHFSEEIGGILLLISIVFICLSKEKNESEKLDELRLKSLITAIYVNTIFLILCFLFVFGFGFVKILIVNIYLPFILFFLFFQYSKYKINSDPKNTLT
jgi:hypothetical protein